MTRQPYTRALGPEARSRALELAKRSAGGKRQVQVATSAAQKGPRTGFDELDDFKRMTAIGQVGKALGLVSPYFRVHEGHAKATTLIDGVECLNFSSYDYLGLNADPRPIAAAKEALQRYGVSASASRLVAGERPVHGELEAALAAHYGSDAALVFVSGHATNVSMIGALMGEDDLVLHDAYIHNSVTTGIQLSGAARRSFAHNDMDALARLLEHSRPLHRNVLIVVEGLYSMDGDLPDLPALIDLKNRYNAWLMVDEAHALGCVGATGAGVFEHFGVDPGEVDIWMGTLSKTLASTGGYVAGGSDLIEFLKNHAAGFVFSVALPPVLAASALSAIEIMKTEPERAEKLQANAHYFIEKARALGLDTALGEGYGVMPVMVGDSAKATKLSERLLERRINVAPVTFPGVPMQMARMRFFLSAYHNEAQIDQALTATKEEMERLDREGFGEIFAAAERLNSGTG